MRVKTLKYGYNICFNNKMWVVKLMNWRIYGITAVHLGLSFFLSNDSRILYFLPVCVTFFTWCLSWLAINISTLVSLENIFISSSFIKDSFVRDRSHVDISFESALDKHYITSLLLPGFFFRGDIYHHSNSCSFIMTFSIAYLNIL